MLLCCGGQWLPQEPALVKRVSAKRSTIDKESSRVVRWLMAKPCARRWQGSCSIARDMRILVATDFSSGAQAALQQAVGLARPLGASLTVLNVFPLPNWVLPDGTVFLADAPTVGEIASRATLALDQIKQVLVAEGMK